MTTINPVIFDTSVTKIAEQLSNQSSVNQNDMKELLSMLTAEQDLVVMNNSGAQLTKSALDDKIKALQEKIEEVENLLKKEYEEITKQQGLLEDEMTNMNNLVNSIEEISKEITQQKLDMVETITAEVMRDYVLGKITEDEVPDKMANLICAETGFCSLPEAELAAKLRVLFASQNIITSIDQKIATSASQITSYQSEIGSYNTLIDIYTAMSNVTKTNAQTGNLNYTGGVPIYSAGKRDLVESLKTQYGKGVVTGSVSGDNCSDSNQYTADLYKALGSGNKGNSILKQMFDQGFSYKEAAYAISYLYGDTTAISFNVNNGKLTIPKGHGGAATWYNEFKTQMQFYWGANSAGVGANDTEDGTGAVGGNTGGNVVNDGTNGNGGGTGTGGGTGVVDEGEPDVNIEEFDPIGWNNGNTSYSFVSDSNNDNIFNAGGYEFIGAREVVLSEITTENIANYFNSELLTNLNITDASQLQKFDLDNDGKITGMEELIMFDTDGNGKIENTELNGLNVLETVETRGQVSFMTAAMAGAKTIDLTKFQDSTGNYSSSLINKSGSVDINGNLTLNNFGVTYSDGRTFNGYQRLDKKDYLDKMFGNAYDAHYTSIMRQVTNEDGTKSVEIDNNATKKETPWKLWAGSQAAQELIAQVEAEIASEKQAAKVKANALEAKGEAEILSEGTQGAERAEEQKHPETATEGDYGAVQLHQDLSHLEVSTGAPDPATNPQEYCDYMNENQETYLYHINSNKEIIKTKK